MSKTPKSPSKSKQDAASPSFEEALEQVENIIDRIERGEIGLEQSLAEYERGVKLIQHCRQIHKHAVQRVDDLTQRLLAGGVENRGEAAGARDDETEAGEQEALPDADDSET